MFRKRPPVSGAQSLQAFPAVLVPRLVPADPLREKQTLQPVYMTDTLSDQSLQFPAKAPTILFLRCRYANHRTDPRFAPFPRHECANKRLPVDPICLGAAMPARNRDRSWVNDVALDPSRDQGAVNPEPVQSRFLDHDHWDYPAGPAVDMALQIRKPLQQPQHIPTPHLIPRQLGPHGAPRVVTSHVERLSSRETKIAPHSMVAIVCAVVILAVCMAKVSIEKVSDPTLQS